MKNMKNLFIFVIKTFRLILAIIFIQNHKSLSKLLEIINKDNEHQNSSYLLKLKSKLINSIEILNCQP
jgi:hypothetical protein